MLKRAFGDELWCVSQPDHAAVAGYLAAHWGNGLFARPGHYAPFPDPERLRAETVLAAAEHDNGWWEWEADPQIDPADGLPLDLTSPKQSYGVQRWRLGVPRFRDNHPYVALLISLHAYWLYAPRVLGEYTPEFLHPIFGNPVDRSSLDDDDLEEARQFVVEQRTLQRILVDRIKGDPEWAATVEPPHLHPHLRLLQLCDALSLHLCFGGGSERILHEIPRTSWNDRVSVNVHPAGEYRVAIDPYPFDQDPLAVTLFARILDPETRPPDNFQTWWQASPRREVRFRFVRSTDGAGL